MLTTAQTCAVNRSGRSDHTGGDGYFAGPAGFTDLPSDHAQVFIVVANPEPDEI